RVTPPEIALLALLATLLSARPAAAAITVSATMIAITHGIGPARRACCSRPERSAPKRGWLRRITALRAISRAPPAAAGNAGRRSDRPAAPCRAARSARPAHSL